MLIGFINIKYILQYNKKRQEEYMKVTERNTKDGL